MLLEEVKGLTGKMKEEIQRIEKQEQSVQDQGKGKFYKT